MNRGSLVVIWFVNYAIKGRFLCFCTIVQLLFSSFPHINQYANGTGTVLGELCIGLDYRLLGKVDIYAKSGLTMTQQALLIPIRLGIRF